MGTLYILLNFAVNLKHALKIKVYFQKRKRDLVKQLGESMETSEKSHIKSRARGTSLVVQWLRLHSPNAGGQGSIPGQGTRSRMTQLNDPASCN